MEKVQLFIPKKIKLYSSIENALLNGAFGFTDYSLENVIGQVIRDKQLALDQTGKGRKELMLIIKPGKESTYQNTVDMLDEVTINGVRKYALTDISVEEEQAVLHRDS